MLLLAHTGITLSAAVLVAGGLAAGQHLPSIENEADESPHRSSQSVLSKIIPPARQASSWLTTLGKRVDIRLLLVAALLPDIIDKPMGHLFFREALSSGRIFGHTLLFLIVITLLGLCLYRSRSQLWLLVIAFGTLMHLILDQMWQTPQTLLWPLFGFTFPREDITGWVQETFQELLTDPAVYIPELIGAVIIIWLGWRLVRNKKMFKFIRYGQIG